MDEDMMETDLSMTVEDAQEEGVFGNDPEAGTIEAFVVERFKRAEKARDHQEQIWLKAYRNYRGEYSSTTQFTEAERSKVFVKITKTKVLAAYGQITDVLFGSNKFPIGIEPTKLPDGVEESVSFETNPQMQQISAQAPQEEQDTKLLPGETEPQRRLRLGALSKKLAPLEGKLVKGEAQSPTQVTFHPAEVSAKKMQKKIYDQLEECNASKELRMLAFECVLFGTGVMKGPFVTKKEYPQWNEEGNYEPMFKDVPSSKYTSVWNFYPDPDGTHIDDMEFVVEVHKLSDTKLLQLNNRPGFRANAIDKAIAYGPNYQRESWEYTMEDSGSHPRVERYQVLEYWGNISAEKLIEHGIEIDRELRDKKQLSCNIWVCNGQLLRCVVNPFTPVRIPYQMVPYEVNPYSAFGVGLGENMEDTQLLMNGFMRLAVDNAVLSGNLIIEIDETNLVPGQNLSNMHAGKIVRRAGGAPGQAIFGTKFPNVANESLQLFDKARQLADESTGLPSFSHGQTGVSGVGRTASGISMLMSAANGSIATVVKNFDDYLLAPLGKAYFHFNMQFDFDKDIKGDLDVVARGTESLMANEVRSQRLMQFLSLVQNPAIAPFARTDYIIREIAQALDLDPDKVTNSMSDAAIQAEIMSKLQPAQPETTGLPGTNPQEGTGDGTVGTGPTQTPGEPGFTGNEQ